MKSATELPFYATGANVRADIEEGPGALVATCPYDQFHDSRKDEIRAVQDAEYLAHACNAYPKLVEALEECVTDEGARCWESREHAERRIRYVDQLARRLLAECEEE